MFASLEPKIGQLLLLLQQVPLNRLKKPLHFGLVLIAAWVLAKITWQSIPAPTVATISSSTPVAAVNASQPVTVLVQDLTRYALFGQFNPTPTTQAPVAVVAEAPKTQLNVKLTGLVSTPGRPEAGSAIIEQRGAEATYAVGDVIEGTRAKLHQVLDDRVLLELNGRFETLMLDGVEFTRIAQANAGLGQGDNAAAVDLVEEPIVLAEPIASGVINPDALARRDEILAEPMKFFDYVRVSPVQRDGQLVGYRLMPGKDAAIFTQMGLQQNDLAIEINGIPLNDMQQAMRVINDLRDATEATLKIERDGEIRDILFSLSQ
ncbi:type II secretion system protein GspC [Alishewanella jeotgali]|mgnify:CR=1 FL=1|uniref:General secretion pathway protein C n=1 Tax=Alishewanella jeotgali KCTC 22429 TaxID=1129374 RepID=H3ZF41_9ALTE|nr:type II secretion system protein GspC [Alishewanella jeotgali]EHR40859.1 general secretion pathway protein C [Alishewanella jeotgali KCTC 22429]